MRLAEQWVSRAWKREGVAGRALHAVLRPASAVFALAARLRALSYRLRLRHRRRLPAIVISVGNLSVGGTGKTPAVLWLAQSLAARGRSVAILSRGYGGNARRPTVVAEAVEQGVEASLDVRVVGDESLMLARRFAGPIIAARCRAKAGALACHVFGVDTLLLDDGFQHLELRRDFDLVCVRAAVPGDDEVLPAGRLREPLSALRRADAVLITKSEEGECRLSPALERHLGKLPVFRGELRAVCLVTPDRGAWRDLPMGLLAERRALGVTGIADPEPFYRTLRQWDARLEDFLEFPDHHVYTLDDWKKIAYRSRGLDLVVTTEKDLVKLEGFPFAKDKLAAVRVAMEVEDGERLVDTVLAAVEKRRPDVFQRRGASGS